MTYFPVDGHIIWVSAIKDFEDVRLDEQREKHYTITVSSDTVACIEVLGNKLLQQISKKHAVTATPHKLSELKVLLLISYTFFKFLMLDIYTTHTSLCCICPYRVLIQALFKNNSKIVVK